MSTTTERPTLTSITVPDGKVVRQYEQTASRDHDATLVPGTYPLTTQRSPEGAITAYTAPLPAIAHDHTRSTVEYGGVALAWEHRGGETEMHGFHAYPWELDHLESAGYVFA